MPCWQNKVTLPPAALLFLLSHAYTYIAYFPIYYLFWSLTNTLGQTKQILTHFPDIETEAQRGILTFTIIWLVMYVAQPVLKSKFLDFFTKCYQLSSIPVQTHQINFFPPFLSWLRGREWSTLYKKVFYIKMK